MDHRDAVRARLAAARVGRAGPGSITWKVNREMVVVAGWGRAILLQLAHPLVAAGVDDHSTFRGSLSSSMRRLASTVRAMLSLTFGDDEQAVAAAAGINTIHDRVSGHLRTGGGRFAAGATYSAHDAELLRWVHATLLDSVPLVYEQLVGPLTPDERDRYCVEGAVMEPLLDIPAGSLPRSAAETERYMREMLDSGKIAVTPASRRLARAVLFPPRGYLVWPAFRPLRLITIGLLPPSVRTAYGFPWRQQEARALARWTAVIRALHRAAPRWAREWPAARRRV
jgi:uncharacterized protein (DUF2236 family)